MRLCGFPYQHFVAYKLRLDEVIRMLVFWEEHETWEKQLDIFV